jgi:prevent-host-death family protein
MKASITDLRRNLKKVLDAVDRGETVTVLYRGKEKATLMPINGAHPVGEPKQPFKSSDHPFFGMWKDREDMKDPVAWVRKIRRSRIRDL